MEKRMTRRGLVAISSGVSLALILSACGSDTIGEGEGDNGGTAGVSGYGGDANGGSSFGGTGTSSGGSVMGAGGVIIGGGGTVSGSGGMATGTGGTATGTGGDMATGGAGAGGAAGSGGTNNGGAAGTATGGSGGANGGAAGASSGGAAGSGGTQGNGGAQGNGGTASGGAGGTASGGAGGTATGGAGGAGGTNTGGTGGTATGGAGGTNTGGTGGTATGGAGGTNTGGSGGTATGGAGGTNTGGAGGKATGGAGGTNTGGSGGAATGGAGGGGNTGVDLTGTWISELKGVPGTISAPIVNSTDANIDLVIALQLSKSAGKLNGTFNICRLNVVTTPDPNSLKTTFGAAVIATMVTTMSENDFTAMVGSAVPVPNLEIFSGETSGGTQVDADNDTHPGVTIPSNIGGVIAISAYVGLDIKVALKSTLTDPNTITGTTSFTTVGKIFGSSNTLLLNSMSGNINVTPTASAIPYTATKLAGAVDCAQVLTHFQTN
jgi:hypothetical protein